MIRRILKSAAFFLILPALVLALDVPKLTQPVVDLAHILSPSETQRLAQKIYLFEQQTTNQIGMLILPSLGGENLEEYSIRVAEKWQLGQAGKDNGVLLLISMADRKIRIETGYGLEGALTDLMAGQIIRNEIGPPFRQQQYFEGLNAGIDAVIAATKNEYKDVAKQQTNQRVENGFSVGSLIFFIFIFMLLGGGRRRRSGLFWLLFGSSMFRGGGRGGFGGGSGFGGGFGGFSGGGGGFGGGGASGGW